MKQQLKNLLAVSLLLAAVQLLVNCTPKNGDSKNAGPGAQSSEIISPLSGTADTGGGTGYKKMFESYIKDPTTFSAYKKYVEPIINNIKTKDGSAGVYSILFKAKTWYFAPIPLKKFSKEALGVTFLKGTTDQIAIQTKVSVWFDTGFFDNPEMMTEQDQGDALLHEMVESIYFFQFFTFAELCQNSFIWGFQGGKKPNDCADYVDKLDRVTPAKPWRKLNDEDNENIRFVTGWLLQNAKQPVKEEDFFKVLYAKGFDKRFFSPNQDNGVALDEIKMTGKELLNILQGTASAGNMPDQCLRLSNGAAADCQIKFEGTQVSVEGIPFPVRGIQISATFTDQTTVVAKFPTNDEVSIGEIRGGGEKNFYNLSLPGYVDGEFKTGDRFHMLYLFFKKNLEHASHASMTLHSAMLNPGVVTSVDGKRDPKCLVQTVKPDQWTSDTVFIIGKGQSVSTAARAYAYATPIPFCFNFKSKNN